MMRLALVLLAFISILFAQGDTDKKISKTHSKLNSYSKNYLRINKKMAKTARKILKQKRQLIKQNRFLKRLKSELSLKEISYKENKKQLSLKKKSQEKLKSQQNKIEEKLVFVIAKSVSLSVVLAQEYTESESSLIEFEVLKAMLNESKKRASRLSNKFIENSQEIGLLKKQTSSLELAISSIDKKRKKLLRTTIENKKALVKLQTDKSSYKKELKILLSRQNTLKDTLAKLNIVKIDEIKKAKEEKARKLAFEKKQIVLDEKLPDVKKHGSSYQSVKTKKYTGVKTIAPLDSYTITKSYGTYTDPIYGIKIFNESLSMKPKQSDAKVKTVFNGKVIYADKTAVLKNIVIVEHRNGLHTIYANLSQISPSIVKGKKIKKGYTLGRVANELIFEVTQKSYHINPIRLFK